MDLANIDLQAFAEQGIEVKLQHPSTGEYLLDGDDNQVSITVLGKDSELWQNTAKRVNAKNAARYKDRKIPPTALENALYEILAECTIQWSKSIEYDSEVLPCNKDNALMLYQKRNWIAEQLIEEAADRSAYFLG